jgi:hypothetical protein
VRSGGRDEPRGQAERSLSVTLSEAKGAYLRLWPLRFAQGDKARSGVPPDTRSHSPLSDTADTADTNDDHAERGRQAVTRGAARLWWWGLAAAVAMGIKLAAAFWAIHQGSRALAP